MKNTGKQRRSDTVLFTLTIVLFAALVFLTASLLLLFNRSASAGDIPFDLDRLTSDDSAGNRAEVADAILPEFIGITEDGKRYGISVSSAVMSDLYGELSAVISETVTYNNARASDEAYWLSCIDRDDSVYIRYHSELPDVVVGMLADMHTGVSGARDRVAAYIYEMFIIPSPDGSGISKIATKSASGDVTVYQLEGASNGLMDADLVKYLRSYTSSMRKFVFAHGEYDTMSATEPVFAESVTTRNILTTDGTTFLIKNTSSAIYQLMRVFGLNPNKLLSTHEDSKGTLSYTDRSGVMYIHKSALEYRASEEGGIDVEDIIGYTDSMGISEYITAVYGLIDNIGAIESHCTGGSADLCLVEISSKGGKVQMKFEYFYDNIIVLGPEPALTVTFESGKLTAARLYTVTIKNVGSRYETFGEWWFFDHLKRDGTVAQNVSLAYRSDYIAESVSAEWRAVAKGTTARYGR